MSEGESGAPQATDTGHLALVRIDAVHPAFGPVEGGTDVTVTGAGFTGEVALWFGGAEVEVTVLGEGTLVATSPEAKVETTVELRVVSDLGEAVLEDGFTYGEGGGSDGGGDTGGDGGDGGGDGGGDTAVGLTSGLVEFSYLVIGCPDCFNLPSNLQINASAGFHEPVSGSWLDWLPPNGSCVLDPSRSSPASSFEDLGSFVYLQSGGDSLSLQRTVSDGQTTYAADGLGQYDYIKNAAWDVVVPDGGAGGAFTADDALATTAGFDDISPLSFLADGSQAFPDFKASAFSFSWSPSGVSSSVVIDVYVYSPTGSSVLGEILCASSDGGSLTVPSSAFTGFPSGALMAIYLYRAEKQSGINPLDGSTIEGFSTFGGLGTGTLK